MIGPHAVEDGRGGGGFRPVVRLSRAFVRGVNSFPPCVAFRALDSEQTNDTQWNYDQSKASEVRTTRECPVHGCM